MFMYKLALFWPKLSRRTPKKSLRAAAGCGQVVEKQAVFAHQGRFDRLALALL
jgi:hypothetical protein